MAKKKISDLGSLTTAATGDLLPIVDISDLSSSVNGTTKKITLANLLAAATAFFNVGDGTKTTSTSGEIAISGTSPRIIGYETDQGADGKFWDLIIAAGILSLRTRTDADGAGNNVLTATRSGTTVSGVTIAPALTLSSSISVGGGSTILKVLSATATLDFPSITTLSNQDLTITVTGAKVGDSVSLGLPAAPLVGVVFSAFVSATDTVTVRAMNYTGTSKDPASATYRVTVFNYS